VAYWLDRLLVFKAMGKDPNPAGCIVGRGVDADAVSSLHANVSLEAEVPEVLFDGMRDFISDHPHWDQYSVITSALAGFLFQNGCKAPTVSQHYLDSLFQRP
jgi:hypothetical protein